MRRGRSVPRSSAWHRVPINSSASPEDHAVGVGFPAARDWSWPPGRRPRRLARGPGLGVASANKEVALGPACRQDTASAHASSLASSGLTLRSQAALPSLLAQRGHRERARGRQERAPFPANAASSRVPSRFGGTQGTSKEFSFPTNTRLLSRMSGLVIRPTL